jgi:1-acyl-sn-glycerol-3-phosphate acyltransferase
MLFVLRAVNFFFRVLNRTKIRGIRHLPEGGGVMVVCNHLSYVDPPLIFSALLLRYGDEVVRGPAKSQLFKYPLLDRFMTSLGAFPVQRTGRNVRSLRRMAEVAKRQKLVIFPEGARSLSGRLEPGLRAVGRVVLDAKPTVIPAAVIGTDRVWSPRMVVPRLFQKLEVRFGPPIDWQQPDHLSRKQAATLITERIMESIQALVDQPEDAAGRR